MNFNYNFKFEDFSPISDFVGRQEELARLERILGSASPNITIVHGRRRVGKTELLEKALVGFNVFKFEGLERQSSANQRRSVLDKLAQHCGDPTIAKLELRSWREVFEQVARVLNNAPPTIVYLEELQWMANYRNELVSDLKYVWDNLFRKIPGFKLILCGSATSFMIKKVVRSKALYGRSSNEIPLSPLPPAQAREILSSYSNKHVLEAYLLLGGIPEYLRFLKDFETPLQAITEESFIPGGYFLGEYEKIFISSLSKYKTHRKVVELFAHYNFLSHSNIAKLLGISPSGTSSEILEDLKYVGLIGILKPYKKRSSLYYISDPYIKFYLKFIYPKASDILAGKYRRGKSRALDHQRLKQYLGYAFEHFCREQHFGLAEILGISGLEYSAFPLLEHGSKSAKEKGFQFDLVFDRKDRCFSFFEIKYRTAALTKSVAEEFEKKLEAFSLPNNYNSQKILVSAGPLSQSLKNSCYFNRIIGIEEVLKID